RAFTWGQHIVAGAGELRPDTTLGRRLLAHELAHTIQHGDSATEPVALSRPGDALEHAADFAAERGADGTSVPAAAFAPAARGSGVVARWANESAVAEGEGPLLRAAAALFPGVRIEWLARLIVRNLCAGPDDHSGRIRHQLDRMDDATRGAV